MQRYAAFLRGMNLGKRRITNDALRAAFADLGFDEPATFRASGNVIFGADGDPLDALRERIETGLEQALGYAVPTFLRTTAQMRAIAAHEPFEPAQVAASKGKLQVMLLAAKPTAAARKQVLALASDEDRLAFRGGELYWLPSGGLLDSPLDLKAIAKALGQATQRTKGTLDLIAEKHFAG